MKPNPSLPLDGLRIPELAARSTFELFANASESMLLVGHAAGDPLSFRTTGHGGRHQNQVGEKR